MSSALAATLYANRAAAHVALSNWEAAVTDAQAAVTLQPNHSKAFHRLATALSALGRFREAVKACHSGAAALAAAGDRSSVFQLLMDQARSAHASAMAASNLRSRFLLRRAGVHCGGVERQHCRI